MTRDLVVPGTASQVPTRLRNHNGNLLRIPLDRVPHPVTLHNPAPADIQLAEGLPRVGLPRVGLPRVGLPRIGLPRVPVPPRVPAR